MIKNKFGKSQFLQKEMMKQHQLLKDTLQFLSTSPFFVRDMIPDPINYLKIQNLKPIYSNSETAISGFFCEDSNQTFLNFCDTHPYSIQNHDEKNSPVKKVYFIFFYNRFTEQYDFYITKVLYFNGDQLSKDDKHENLKNWNSYQIKFQFTTKRVKNMLFYYDEHIFAPFGHIQSQKEIQKKFKKYCSNDTFNAMRFIFLIHNSTTKPIGYKLYKGYLKNIFWSHPKIKPIPSRIHKPTHIQLNKKHEVQHQHFNYFKKNDKINYAQEFFKFLDDNNILPKKNFNLTNSEIALIEMNNILNL